MNPMNCFVRTGNSLTIRNWLIAAVLGGCAVGMVSAAMAGGSRATEKRYFLRSKGKSWHSSWYDPSVGRPMALVVPPTAEFISEYSWGVPSSRTMPLYQQFYRPYPGPGAVPGQTVWRSQRARAVVRQRPWSQRLSASRALAVAAHGLSGAIAKNASRWRRASAGRPTSTSTPAMCQWASA